jgi:hypothetical protein
MIIKRLIKILDIRRLFVNREGFSRETRAMHVMNTIAVYLFLISVFILVVKFYM